VTLRFLLHGVFRIHNRPGGGSTGRLPLAFLHPLMERSPNQLRATFCLMTPLGTPFFWVPQMQPSSLEPTSVAFELRAADWCTVSGTLVDNET
jgi:hypothetical protein